MPTSPTPAADRPADQLRAAAERARKTGDPLHLVAAGLLEVAAQSTPAASVDETARAALAVARQLLGTSAAEGADESCGRFVPDTPRAPSLCASCGDAKGWHSLLATAEETAPPAPADRAAPLRDRIADALAAADGWEWGPGHDSLTSSVIGRYLRRADAVLAVLDAPADRAAVLREAAEAVDNTEFPDEYVDLFDNGARWASRLLRRLADGAVAGAQPPTTTEAHPPSYPWSQSVHSVDGGQTIHITWDDPEGNPGGSVRVDASDRNVLAFMLADGAPGSDDAPDAPSVRCSVANLRRWPHPPHSWEPQPGMTPVRCPGTPPAAPAAPEEPTPC